MLTSYIGNTQDIQVKILGSTTTVSNGGAVSFSAGNTISFRITNTRNDCDKVKIEDIIVSNTIDFSISSDKIPTNVDTESCKGKTKYVDFTITNKSGNCGASTDIAIEVKQNPDFEFEFSISGNPAINVLGGSPLADINNGSTTITATNGTYFGVVDAGVSVTRDFIIANTGSCPLGITGLTSSSSDYTYTSLPAIINSGSSAVLSVTFTGPPAGAGTKAATITIANTANTSYTFKVSAEMFNFAIPGPGGITADFRLWLKSTRGITKDGSNNVSDWADIGTNGKNASQAVLANQPLYVDDANSNINFNPVIKFQNDGSKSQYLYNTDNGFYSQEIFIVMQPDVDVSTSSGMTIFSGTVAYPSSPAPTYTYSNTYVNDINDVSGVGLGNFTGRISSPEERLWYNQGNSVSDPYYTLLASTSRSYNKAAIINARNKSNTVTDGMSILYNSFKVADDPADATKSSGFVFENLGYIIDNYPSPDDVFGTPYLIGKNANTTLGNLNGRVAEIFTFASRLSDLDRQKIESYLAIKYGITLEYEVGEEKDYINSFGPIDGIIWDVSENADYNHNIAGIGRDDDSDLYQKQSKTINETNEVTIGLGGVFDTNSANVNEFEDNGDFLVWGCNNLTYNGSDTNTVTLIESTLSTTLTRIDRKWKIVESNQGTGDIGIVYLSIPEAAFSAFSKDTNEEYVLIVANDPAFADTNIIDVLPLKFDEESEVYKTWYDFHDTKYFSFGITSKVSKESSITIDENTHLVGEYLLDLNPNSFTVSAWIKSTASTTNPRTIIAKGDKLQMRLNESNQVEVWMDDDNGAKITSNMAITDGNWHQVSFVYNSGTIFLYIDGVLDHSKQNIAAPTPNFNYLSIGSLYIDKNTISNPLLGEIDEVYIWNQALTERQVRYLMNQEVARFDVSSTDYVSGKIIPGATLSSEIASIPWSTLTVYYDFNSFCGTAVEGLTDATNCLRLNYLVPNKSIVGEQTAPLPYLSAADGDWDAPATWSNSADQAIPNSIGLDGTTEIDWNIVQISNNILGNRDITLLGLISNSGTLTIAAPGEDQDENNSGQELIITHYLELDGVIDLVGESQLIQTEGSIIDEHSSGYLERDQQGTANGFNYNYWSSSVGPLVDVSLLDPIPAGTSSANSSVAIENFLYNGYESSLPMPMEFEDVGYDFTPPSGTSPGLLKIFTYWLYKFYGAADDYGAWAKINKTTPLQAGEGFTMKGPAGTASIATRFNYVFRGLPYNGDITLALDKTSGDVERLIGNPYPSAIDAEEFILDNISVAEGGNNSQTVINGALYFWDHFGEENSHYLKDYVGGYATYNLSGGAPAISNDVRINNSGASSTKVPGQYIPVNQGFFVSTKLETLPNDNGGNIAAVEGGNIIFKNRQRVFVTELEEFEDVPVSVFMKSSSSKKSSVTETQTSKKKKSIIRLMYDSPKGYHRQIVLGANEKASNGFDLGYDAFMVDVNEEDMYWYFNKSKFVIQGVANFDATQEFSLGLVVKTSGTIKIKLDAMENIDANLPLFIKDELTGEIKKINDEAFEINLEPGVYNDRFKLMFKQLEESSIEAESTVEESAVTIRYNSKSEKLKLQNNDKIKIKDLGLYDILGNEIKSLKLNTKSDVTLTVSSNTGLYIVKLNTEKGLVTKKIIIE
ncbi:LamG-like jellyroll fold domain-containing protein [Mariniflexile aquimaris]|uniref:LamG-like jellyroll fold domain-containing protein n=1 Tax=Mariniflexile aquimaris TaxID=881009 RepID=A0ABW3BYU1_9FLAO